MLRTTTSIGMISTSRTSCSRMLRRRTKCVGTPISPSLRHQVFGDAVVEDALAGDVPFFWLLKAVASSLKYWTERAGLRPLEQDLGLAFVDLPASRHARPFRAKRRRGSAAERWATRAGGGIYMPPGGGRRNASRFTLRCSGVTSASANRLGMAVGEPQDRLRGALAMPRSGSAISALEMVPKPRRRARSSCAVLAARPSRRGCQQLLPAAPVAGCGIGRRRGAETRAVGRMRARTPPVVRGRARSASTARPAARSRRDARVALGGPARGPERVAVVGDEQVERPAGAGVEGGAAPPAASARRRGRGLRARSSPRERRPAAGPSVPGRLSIAATTPWSLTPSHVPPASSSRPATTSGRSGQCRAGGAPGPVAPSRRGWRR